jgi:hypothetical protein
MNSNYSTHPSNYENQLYHAKLTENKNHKNQVESSVNMSLKTSDIVSEIRSLMHHTLIFMMNK